MPDPLPITTDGLLDLDAVLRTERVATSADHSAALAYHAERTPSARAGRYAQAALTAECAEVASTGPGARNARLNASAFSLAQLVGAGALDENDVRVELEAAAAQCGLPRHEARKTIESGLRAGIQRPREIPERSMQAVSRQPGYRHPQLTVALSDTEWPDPIPLREHDAPPSFPVAVLPGWLRDWVAAESHATQTPPDMAAMLALAVVATCCARRMVVRVRDGWVEPTNLYTCIVLPPGSRKSAVYRDAVAPLETHERSEAERLVPSIAQAVAHHRVAEQALRATEARAAKAAGPEQTVAMAEVRSAVDALRGAEAAIPVAPRFVTGDATQEALARLLAQHGRMAVMDAEGCGPIALMLGRYTQSGAVSVDVYLRGHAGDTIRIDRAGREPITVRDPAITLAITAQPEVLRQLGQHREVRGLGLLARILWVLPRSTVGRRSVEPEPVLPHVRAAYERQVAALLALEPVETGDAHTLAVSMGAWAELRALMERVEPQLCPGGDLGHVADWAGKLAGAVARIAGLLHVAEHAAAPWSSEVSADTMRRAIAIGDYLLAHALAALGGMGADPVIADAEHVLDWLRAQEVRTISRRDLYRGVRGRFARSDDLIPVLGVLAERGWLRLVEVAAGGAATRTTQHIEVTPRLPDRRDRRDTRAPSVPCVPCVPVGGAQTSAEADL